MVSKLLPIIYFLVLLFIKTSSVPIPFIQDKILQSTFNSNTNTTLRLNSSCEECLCDLFFSNNTRNYLALNCFANGTCQYFLNFPSSYKLISSSGSRLYFLQNQLPAASQCCMSNISELMIRLKSVVPTVVNLTFQPSAFGYDQHTQSAVAVIGWNPGAVYWFNPLTMNFIRNYSVGDFITVTVNNNLTYSSTPGIPTISIRNSLTNAYIANISYPNLIQNRKMVFIDNGTRMIISTQSNNSVTILRVNSLTNYTIQEEIYSPLPLVHGVAKVNDTLFYASSWNTRGIYSFQYENSTWISRLFINETATGDGSHLLVDECERIWYVNTQFGLRIYNSSGIEIANWNMNLSSLQWIYDILLLQNYVLLVTHVQEKKLVQYDPQVTCE